jgi:hypothetical protein
MKASRMPLVAVILVAAWLAIAIARTTAVAGAEPSNERGNAAGGPQGKMSSTTSGDPLDRETQIAGRVTDVDAATGITTVLPEHGEPLVLQFKPESVAGLKSGERINTRVTYSISPPPQLGSPAGDAPLTAAERRGMRMEDLQAATGQNSVTGTVDSLDRKTGRFDLKTSSSRLRLALQPAVVQSLQPGQTITVEMGFSKIAP